MERFLLEGRLPKGVGWSAVAKVVTRKLDMLDYAAALRDLASPPGNHLEALKGKLDGFHSIRINDQWRVASGGLHPVLLKWMFTTTIEEKS